MTIMGFEFLVSCYFVNTKSCCDGAKVLSPTKESIRYGAKWSCFIIYQGFLYEQFKLMRNEESQQAADSKRFIQFYNLGS